MSRTNSIDAAAFRASSEYYLLNDLAIRLCEDKAEFYYSLFQEHFTYMRNAETLTNLRNAHNKFITDIQADLREIVKNLPPEIKLVYDKDEENPKLNICSNIKPVNFKINKLEN